MKTAEVSREMLLYRPKAKGKPGGRAFEKASLIKARRKVSASHAPP